MSSGVISKNEKFSIEMRTVAVQNDPTIHRSTLRGINIAVVTCELDDQMSESFSASLTVRGNGHWYGMAERGTPAWPLERATFQTRQFVCGDICKDPDAFGGVLEPYWLCSSGIAVIANDNLNIYVEVTTNELTITATQSTGASSGGTETLCFKLFSSDVVSLRDLHLFAMKTEFGLPSRTPDEIVFSKPIWSTWAKFKTDINSDVVGHFVTEITRQNLPIGILGIDDKWASEYGDFTFDPRKFSCVSDLFLGLKKKFGIRIILWIHPFVHENSSSFAAERVFSSKTEWWNGKDYLLDFTEAEVCLWFKESLEKMRESCCVDGFKFDAGEYSYAPHELRTADRKTFKKWKQNYVSIAAQFDGLEEVRVSCSTKQHGLLVRLMDKESTWNGPNGLQSVIPSALTVSLLGYPFVLPDMIGGNGYGQKPSCELFVRWLQTCVLMPAIQFSIPPWDYGDEATQITRAMLDLRSQYVPLIIDLARDAVRSGSPIIRPMWWLCECEDCLCCADQFVLGDSLVVAPVQQEGAVARWVMLPPGIWRCNIDGFHHMGPSRIYQICKLSELPIFESCTLGDF